jgi:DNA polymerase (family 10)
MPSNAEAAELFRSVADLLDVLGERFKPEAYRRAARSIDTLTEDLGRVAARNELSTIPGVGEAIAEKIREYLTTGQVHYYERLKKEVPPGLVEIMHLPGLGPKTARRFWVELGIEGPNELEDAITTGKLDSVKGFGPRKIELIRTALEQARTAPAAHREPIEIAYPVASRIVRALRERSRTDRVEAAGSFRRRRETVGDLDILVTSDEPEKVFETFSALPEVREVRMRGGTKETVVLASGLQVDLRVVEPAAFGAALQYFTGSKDHNVHLRTLAHDRGLKINEYGVFRADERVGGRTEEEVYAALGLPWIPPELREDRGEIEVAIEGRLPKLVEEGDLIGDLHVHLPPPATAADVDRVLSEAHKRGYAYLGVVVGGAGADGQDFSLPPAARARLEAIRDPGLKVLRAVEVGPGTGLSAFRGVAADYAIVRPTGEVPASGSLATSALPVRLVAHGSDGSVSDDEKSRRWVETARAVSAAVEVGPGPERLDSTGARRARESGLSLAIPTGVGLGSEDPTLPIAVGFARRAGAIAREIVNARPASPAARRRARSGR